MQNIRNLKHIFIIILLSLTMLFVSIMIFSREFGNSVNGFFVYRTGTGVSGEPVWQDSIYTHTLTPSTDIVIIAIDEQTLNTLQSQSDTKNLIIPKSVYTDLVNRLEGVGVRGIGFDIVFQNTDPTELEFSTTLASHDNIVIASTRESGKCTPDLTGSGITCPGAPRSIYTTTPWGLIDIDDIYRRPLRYDISGTEYKNWDLPSRSISTLSLVLARLTSPTLPGVGSLDTSYDRSILSPFFGPPGSYRYISLSDVLSMSRLDLMATFAGKYVFVGESGTLIHDSFVSPVTGTQMAGVEVHAHMLDALLQDRLLYGFGYTLLVAIGLTIAMCICYFVLPSYISPIIAVAMMIAIVWITRYMYDQSRLLIDIFPLFLSGAFLTFPLTFIYRFFIVDRQKHHIQSAFGHYIDPKMVEMIDLEQVEMTLGGEQRELSVFFSDIAGFTTISEKLGTKDLFYLMSAYLSHETDILIGEGGTLDKYIGDAVMGFFGAPVPEPDHAMRACRTALAMRSGLPDFNTEIQKRGIDPIEFRIGIATGEVMIGNIGSRDHFNYTVLGDTVNLASRLEATGKEYGVHVIISEGTRLQIGSEFLLRELDTIAVKGKTEGVRIYELLGRSTEILDMDIYTQYETALILYRSNDYLGAGRLWESQMEIDPPSRVMALRCVDILRGGLTVEDGVYHMTHK